MLTLEEKIRSLKKIDEQNLLLEKKVQIDALNAQRVEEFNRVLAEQKLVTDSSIEEDIFKENANSDVELGEESTKNDTFASANPEKENEENTLSIQEDKPSVKKEEEKSLLFNNKTAFIVGATAIEAKALQNKENLSKSISIPGGIVANSVPGLGAALGVTDTVNRSKDGDYLGAAMSAGAAVTSTVPGAGTAASLTIQTFQAASDYLNVTGENRDGSTLKKRNSSSPDENGVDGSLSNYALVGSVGKNVSSEESISSKQSISGLNPDYLTSNGNKKEANLDNENSPGGYDQVLKGIAEKNKGISMDRDKDNESPNEDEGVFASISNHEDNKPSHNSTPSPSRLQD